MDDFRAAEGSLVVVEDGFDRVGDRFGGVGKVVQKWYFYITQMTSSKIPFNPSLKVCPESYKHILYLPHKIQPNQPRVVAVIIQKQIMRPTTRILPVQNASKNQKVDSVKTNKLL